MLVARKSSKIQRKARAAEWIGSLYLMPIGPAKALVLDLRFDEN